jgi:hypothetical protein
LRNCLTRAYGAAGRRTADNEALSGKTIATSLLA